MPLAPFDEAGLLQTDRRVYDLVWHYRTLMARMRARVVAVGQEAFPITRPPGEDVRSSTFSSAGGGGRIIDCVESGCIAAQNIAAEAP
jgi:hypothetical protein